MAGKTVYDLPIQASVSNTMYFLASKGISAGDDVRVSYLQLKQWVNDDHLADLENPHEVSLEQARAVNNLLDGNIDLGTHRLLNIADAISRNEPLTKGQFDDYVAIVGRQRGDIDCSTNPNYPEAEVGDRFEVTVAGKIGGASGVSVDVYDEIVCKQNTAGGSQGTAGASFYVVQGNISRATELVSGYSMIATLTDALAATNDEKFMTPLKTLQLILAQKKNFVNQIVVNRGTQYLNETVMFLGPEGTITAIDKSDTITNLKVRLGSSGAYATASLPFNFSGQGSLWFQWDYLGATQLNGFIRVTGKDN